MHVVISGNSSVTEEMAELAGRLACIEDLSIGCSLVPPFPRSAHPLSSGRKAEKQRLIRLIDRADLFILYNKKVEDGEVKEGYIDGDSLDFLDRAIELKLPIIYAYEVGTSHLTPPDDYKWRTPVMGKQQLTEQIEKLKFRHFGFRELLK